ncbi:DUF995 domain-containing protein [Roseibium sp. RKSG952]|uniref:DUF995 domain-containing protein n=1 Tax=Roseibium sp. RKSG952 TaxID=2529384 RepID=UPI0012BC8EDF|nr:DUF995 domain-containing protein [Roseibium sp. RKSG952]MTH97298.1 DUF995 domain-containing protein [Roseibium sp. RKSG952]
MEANVTSSLFPMALLLILAPATALAGKLPDTAKPVSAAELTKIYSNKSTNWSKSRAYFAPDGAYYIIGKNKNWYGTGKWNVKGNRICARVKWRTVDRKDTGKALNCWTWYKDGRGYVMVHNKEGRKSDDYYTSERSKLSRGDKVTRTYYQLSQK